MVFNSSLADWDGRLSAKSQRPTKNAHSNIYTGSSGAGSPGGVLNQHKERSASYLGALSMGMEERQTSRWGGEVYQDVSTKSNALPSDTYIYDKKPRGGISKIVDSDIISIQDEDDVQTTFMGHVKGRDDDDVLIVDRKEELVPNLTDFPFPSPKSAWTSPNFNKAPSPASPSRASMKSLFTPSPSPSPSRSPRKRLFISHIAVPPMPKGLRKTDYRSLEWGKVSKSPPKRTVYRNLEEAFQASINHNESVGALHTTARQATLPAVPLNTTMVASSSTPARHTLASQATKRKLKSWRESEEYSPYDYRKKAKSIKESQRHDISSDVPRSTLMPHTPSSEPVATNGRQPSIYDYLKEKLKLVQKPQQDSIASNAPGKHTPLPSQYIDAVQIYIGCMPKDEWEVLSINVRFLQRQKATDLAENMQYPVMAAMSEGKGRPCWLDWPGSSCQSLEGIKELSLGGFLTFWDDVDAESADESIELRRPQEEKGGSCEQQASGSRADSEVIKRSIHATESPKSTGFKPKSSGGSSTTVPESESHWENEPSSTNDPGDKSQPSAKSIGKQKMTSPIVISSSDSSTSSPQLSLSSRLPILSDNLTHSASAVGINLSKHGSMSSPALSPIYVSSRDSIADVAFPGPSSAIAPVNSGLGSFLTYENDPGPNSIFGDPYDDLTFNLPPLNEHSPIHGLFMQEPIPSHISDFHAPQGRETIANPWTDDPTSPDHLPFGNGTIDPSLLGGDPAVEDDTFPADEPPLASQCHSPLDPHSPASSVSRLPSLSGSNYSHSSISAPVSPQRFLLRSHQRSRRVPSNMIATEELNLSSSSSSDEGNPRPPAIVVQKASKKAPVNSGKSRRNESWPRQPEDTYCHQCRNKTNILKLSCVCKKLYCVRCISTRYNGQLTYDPSCTDFTCPFCKGNCTCDVCMRKRGEVYIPMRRGIAPVKSDKDSVMDDTQPIRQRLGGKTNLPPPTVNGPVTYWAAMYDLTGNKVGRAFVGKDGNEAVIVQPLQRGTRRQKRKRVFVGEIQSSWRLGDNPLLKELEPIPWKDRNNGPNERIYVGKKSLLYKPVASDRRETDGILLDGLMSPLSSIEDVNERTGEGESRQWPFVTNSYSGIVTQESLELFVKKGPEKEFSMNSLGDKDITRAISLGLMACGVQIQFSSH